MQFPAITRSTAHHHAPRLAIGACVHPQLIAVKEVQLQRATEVKEGRVNEAVLAPLSITLKDTRTPALTSKRYTDICAALALRLSGVMPLIDKHPQLLARATHPYADLQRWRAETAASALSTHTDHALLPCWSNTTVAALLNTLGSHRGQLTPEQIQQLHVLERVVEESRTLHIATW
jgi:hypothetical protein